jgi:hypothetical protein
MDDETQATKDVLLQTRVRNWGGILQEVGWSCRAFTVFYQRQSAVGQSHNEEVRALSFYLFE